MMCIMEPWNISLQKCRKLSYLLMKMGHGVMGHKRDEWTRRGSCSGKINRETHGHWDVRVVSFPRLKVLVY